MFEHIALGGGASETQVEAVLQDRRGFLWIGTSNGLYRYDGYTFSVYQHDPDDANSLSHNMVYALVEDRSGSLWIGTEGGLNHFDPATEVFTRFLHDPDDPNSLSNDWVAAVYAGRDGTVWVGTVAGLDRLDPGTGGASFAHYQYDVKDPHSLGSGRVEAICEDRDGVLWVGTWGGGLSRLDRAADTFTHYLPAPDNLHSLSNDFVQSIYEDRSGRLWIGTAAGLDGFDRERGTFTRFRFETDNTVGLRTVHSVHLDADGMLWVGAFGGLHRVDPVTEQVTHYRHHSNDPNSVRDSDVFKVFADRSGVLWLGTRSGLDKVKRTPFARYQHARNDPDSLGSGDVLALYEDRAGVLWIGTNDGLNRFDRETQAFTFIPYNLVDPFVRGDYNEIFSIYEDPAGALWVGAYDGLSRFDRQTETFTRYPHDPVMAPGHDGYIGNVKVVTTIYAAPSQPDVLWLGTRTDLYRFDPYGSGDFVYYEFETTHPQGWHTVYAIYEAPSQPGVLWIGTVGGFNKLEVATGAIAHYRHDPDDPHSLSGDEVYAIYEGPAGALWVGTRDGLSRFDRQAETFTRFTTRDGLPDNFVKGILGDEAGHLWISTGKGLARFNPATLTFRTYDAHDGLSGNVFLEGAYHRNQRGELFFGGQDGFTIFHPRDILDNAQAPSVVLTDFKVLGKSVNLGQPIAFTPEIELFSNQNTFSFEFAALDFTAPEQNQYAYTLEGFDDAWVESGTRRFARYPNVPPGRYVFRVRGSNSDGVWDEAGASVRIVITPPFWQTGWFFALCLLVGVLLVVSVGYVVRTRRLRQHARALEALVEERTRDLVAEKEKTEEQARRLVELDEAKNRFFANISHEFRTPLTLILGPLQDALDGRYKDDPVQLEKEHRLMHRNARRLLRLINQLLDLSRLESGRLDLHPEPGDLVSFVQQLARAFVPLAERRGIGLTFHTHVEQLALAFDADALEKVVSNLLSNALKFTSEGGKVLVAMHTVEMNGASSVAISVKDTGPGIAEEDRARIFDRFQQADTSIRRKHEGSGVGLALAKELTELHGGTLMVESRVGVGSIFTVYLPLVSFSGIPFSGEKGKKEESSETEAARMEPDVLLTDGEVEPIETAPAHAEPDPFRIFGKPKILIVEDNADVRAYLRSHLDEEYHVLEAEDGEAGLEAAREVQPDLVLSDLMMPRMDGYEMCRLMKANDRLRHIPVVMLTAKAAERDTVEGIESGADDYLAKPFSVAELKARLAHLIATRREMREQYSREVVVQPAGIVIETEEEVFLDRVLGVVNEHLGESSFSVDWLAEEVGLSRRQLERRVEAATGEAPAELIRRLRLERASQLLRAQAGTVAEIAYTVGFSSASHFAKAFRKAYHVSPTEHIAQAAEQDAS